MKVLSPIDVEMYEAKFRQLSENLDKAAGFLIPDAYQTEKEQLNKAREIVNSHFTGFNEVLNSCSVGVLFNESILPVESVINQTVVGLLWDCQDTISDIMMFSDDFSEYLVNVDVMDPMYEKLDKLILVEKTLNSIINDLDVCSVLIMSVLVRLDGYNI